MTGPMEDSTLKHLASGYSYVNGAFARPARVATVTDKASDEAIGTVGLCGADNLTEATTAAKRAQREWGRAPFTTRQQLLLRLADELEANRAALTRLISIESGSIAGKAEYEVSAAIEEVIAAVGLAGQPSGEVLSSHDPDRLSISERVPIGVVAVITPWNFPLVLAMRVIAPAIALGNAVILKPSPETPLSGGIALAHLFDDAGTPAGVFQVLCGDKEFSESLVAHDDVDMVHFTGSSAVGRNIARVAGDALKRVSLELGGNNALIVLDDADIERASMYGAWSAFHFQGQTCISVGRHIVSAHLVDAYTEALATRASRLKVGNPLEPQVHLGPLVNARQFERARQLLDRSVAAGAEVVTGGRMNDRYLQPTVLSNVTRDMPVWTEEIFAPIAPIVAFEDDEEAVEIANDTAYGLVNSIITASEKRGLRIARELQAGMIHINDATPTDEPSAPFGGIRASGLGSYSGGQVNLEAFTERRWVTVQLGMPDYPF